MSVIRQSKKILTADFPPRKVVFNTRTHLSHILNETAAVIWDLCKTPKREADIAAYLTQEYSISADDAERDVKNLIKELERKGLVRIYGRQRKI